MPKVRPLCEEQRVEARCRKRTQALVDGLVLHKARNKVINKDISAAAGTVNWRPRRRGRR